MAVFNDVEGGIQIVKDLAAKSKADRDAAEKAVDVYEDRICRIVEYKQSKLGKNHE